MILHICDNASIIEAMRIINIVITIVKIAVPIMLMVKLMLDLMSEIKAGNDEVFKKSSKLIVNRVIASVIIFLIPSLVELVVTLSSPDSGYLKCLNADAKIEYRIEDYNI